MKRLALAFALATLPLAAQAEQPEQRTVADILVKTHSTAHFGSALTNQEVMKITFSGTPITVLVPVSSREWAEQTGTPERGGEIALAHILVGGMHTPRDLTARTMANRGHIALRTAAGTTVFIEPAATGGFLIRDTRGNTAHTRGPTLYARNGIILFIDSPLSD
jgi:hypothetical protein